MNNSPFLDLPKRSEETARADGQALADRDAERLALWRENGRGQVKQFLELISHFDGSAI